jgi:hypothetical protein
VSLTFRDNQIPTSGFRSRVPPNHAATKPAFVSAMVEAWHCGNGAVSKMNSDLSKPGCSAANVLVATKKPTNKANDLTGFSIGLLLTKTNASARSPQTSTYLAM